MSRGARGDAERAAEQVGLGERRRRIHGMSAEDCAAAARRLVRRWVRPKSALG